MTHPHDLLDLGVHLDLREILGLNLHLRCEGFNFAGSIKLRAARWLVDEARAGGRLTRGSVLVESSSGNMGVALATVAAGYGLGFVCVTDSRCTPANLKMMRALGARVETVGDTGAPGGLLAARKARVQALCAADPRYVWLDQYTNTASSRAHYETTAAYIAKAFPGLDVLFVGVGTGGTASGCARYFAENAPHVRVVAVDAVGSVNFSPDAGPRRIPGLGAAVPMPLVDRGSYDDVVLVEEADTVRMCRRLAAAGLLLGGSSGTVVSAAQRWLGSHDPRQRCTAVAIAPDLGERYLDTLYDDAWVRDAFPGVLPCEPAGRAAADRC
ncbi:pyridoxal-phosphate dependent enzyme [Streptomyces sp. NPDC004031]